MKRASFLAYLAVGEDERLQAAPGPHLHNAASRHGMIAPFGEPESRVEFMWKTISHQSHASPDPLAKNDQVLGANGIP